MRKSEFLRSIQQEMTLERMGEDIAIITGDVQDMKLDIVTIQNDIAELRQMIREQKERKRKNGTANKGTQD